MQVLVRVAAKEKKESKDPEVALLNISEEESAGHSIQRTVNSKYNIVRQMFQ